jgi:tRNA 2-selenouridine synthase
MPVQKIAIQEFLQLALQHPVFDVRSPGEYNHAHIPGAHNLALFSDAERAVVGTTYKKQSRQQAIKTGLDYFGPKMRGMVETVEKIVATSGKINSNTYKQKDEAPQACNTILVHCWRGGMRSAAIAWLLDLYGFKVYTLAGGYKAYRNWVLAQFTKAYKINIIGGYTGSGKTQVLQQLAQQHAVIDLETLANHKGSAFGSMGTQPTQEMFENLLAKALLDAVSGIQHPASSIYIEDESQRIGNLQIPMGIWRIMRSSPVYFLDIPFEERLNYITTEYGKLEKEKLVNAVIRIQKRLGGLDTKLTIAHIIEDDYKAAFTILLRYYDKWYTKGLNNRENIDSLLNKIPCTSVDTAVNTQKIIACFTATV